MTKITNGTVFINCICMCLNGYSGGVGQKLLQGLLLTNMFWSPEEAQVGRLKWFSFKMLWMNSLHHWWWWKAESRRHCAAAGSWHWRCGYKRNKISTKGKRNTRKLLWKNIPISQSVVTVAGGQSAQEGLEHRGIHAEADVFDWRHVWVVS